MSWDNLTKEQIDKINSSSIWVGDHLFLIGDKRPWVLGTIKSFDPDTEVVVKYQPENLIETKRRSDIERRCTIKEAVEYYDNHGLGYLVNKGMRDKAKLGL